VPVRDEAPVLSVVTPVYNSARYLSDTLESVARVTVPHEHIVIDGGSTDGTVELLEARADPRLRWLSEPDRGQTHAVNKGFAQARGALLAWLNGDDEYVADAVDRAVALLRRMPSLDAVYGCMEITDATGTSRRLYRPWRFNWRLYLVLGDYVTTPTIIFRRKLLEDVAPLDETYVDAADYDFYLRLLRHARVERLPEPLVRFRYQPESKTGRDYVRGQREALQIRLKWARGRPERLLMEGVHRLKHALLPRVSRWPRMYS
jgi:glycosyltransferase involved in cell wall biosynthesis